MMQELEDVQDDDGPRTLTPADVRAIVEQLEKKMTQRFFENLGRGLWGLLLAGLAAVLLFLAAWGARIDSAGH